MKRTNIVLDERLVGEGLKLTGLKTQKDLIHVALQQLVRREKQLGLLKLKGKIDWEGDLDLMRKGRAV
jgi:Arc/MetJ family transcription regulator